MGNEWSRDVALLKELERKFGKTLSKKDRIRLHRLIREIEAPRGLARVPRRTPWSERMRNWLGTIAKIALALGLKKLLDHIGGQA